MQEGNIVCSLSGHDKGCFLVIVGKTEKGFLVCDGKRRRLSQPKLKNQKHLKLTGWSIDKEKLISDKSIKRGIFAFKQAFREEEKCQKKI